jgi:hypothetical protein
MRYAGRSRSRSRSRGISSTTLARVSTRRTAVVAQCAPAGFRAGRDTLRSRRIQQSTLYPNSAVTNTHQMRYCDASSELDLRDIKRFVSSLMSSWSSGESVSRASFFRRGVSCVSEPFSVELCVLLPFEDFASFFRAKGFSVRGAATDAEGATTLPSPNTAAAAAPRNARRVSSAGSPLFSSRVPLEHRSTGLSEASRDILDFFDVTGCEGIETNTIIFTGVWRRLPGC